VDNHTQLPLYTPEINIQCSSILAFMTWSLGQRL